MSQCDAIVLDKLTLTQCGDSGVSKSAFASVVAQFNNLTNISFVNVELTDCFDDCQIVECRATDEFNLEDFLSTVFIQLFVFMLVFGLAGSVDFEHFKLRFQSRGIKIGLICQFLFMPLIGFLTILMFNNVLEPLYAVILLIICASPGGSYSNWWCNLINADLALSVAMTTVSTIMSMAILPLNIFLYVEFGYKTLSPENAQDVIKLLPFTVIGYTLAVVITAIITGMLFGIRFPQHRSKVNKMGTTAGFISIAIGVFASSTSCAKPWNQNILLYVATAIPCLSGLFLAMGLSTLASLPKPQRVAVSIETAYQNTGIALAVSLALGPAGRAAAVVPVVYGAYEAIFFGIFVIMSWYIGWTLSPEDESFCQTLVADHQGSIATHPHYKGYYGDDNAGIDKENDRIKSNQVAVSTSNS